MAHDASHCTPRGSDRRHSFRMGCQPLFGPEGSLNTRHAPTAESSCHQNWQLSEGRRNNVDDHHVFRFACPEKYLWACIKHAEEDLPSYCSARSKLLSVKPCSLALSAPSIGAWELVSALQRSTSLQQPHQRLGAVYSSDRKLLLRRYKYGDARPFIFSRLIP